MDSSLCETARQFLDEGNSQEHDRILREEIEISLKQFDLIVLAQASMGRVLDTLDGKERNRILTSPTLAIEHIRKRYVSPV